MGALIQLGLEIVADSSQVDAAVKSAEAAADELKTHSVEASAETAAAGEKVNENLLTSNESARLLSQEMGIRLPRAVTAAIGRVEALQGAMAAVGSVALALFAAKEMGSGLVTLQKWSDEITGIDRTAKDTFRELLDASEKQIGANEKILEQLTGRNLLLEAEAAKQYRIGVEIAELSAKMADRERQQLEILTRLPSLYELAVPAIGMVYKSSRDLYEMLVKNRDVSQDFAHAQQKAADVAVETAIRIVEAGRQEGEAQRRLAEEAARRAKEAAAEANRQARQESEFIIRVTEEGDRSTKRMQKWHEEWLKSLGMPETVKFSIQELNRAVNQSGLAAASALPALTALASGYHAFSEAERAALPLTHELESAILRMAEGQRELFTEIVSGQLPAMRRLELEQARQLDAARREIAMMHEKVAQHKATRAEEERLEEQYTELVVTQAKLRQEAQKRDTEEQAEGLAVAAAGLLGRLGLRKAEAIVEAGVEIAKAYACYGDHDYWGAAQHLISAADWGIVAGQSTGAGGGGGGPAPSAGVRGGFSGPTAPGATGTVTPMTPGLTSIGGPAPGGRAINVHVYGPYEEATHIATVLNDLTERRGGKLISSRTIAPPKAGR